MNVIRKGRFKKGVALVFALMTIIILFSIANTVTAVSINNGRTTKTVSYNDFALQAANWGIEAAIEYMGQAGDGTTSDASQWQSDSHGGYWLTEDTKKGGYGRIKSLPDVAGIRVSVTKVGSAVLKSEYGLDYDGTKTLGADTWRDGDSKKIVFVDKSNDTRHVLSGGGEKNDVTVEVICTEYRNANKQRPSSYELLSVAKVSSPSASGVSVADGPNAKGVLSTRVVCAMVRQEQVSDFMHFVQNARTFDAIDTALADDSTLRKGLQAVVYLPQSYKESGRLRVDGYGDDNPEKNRLKRLLHEAKVDGTLGFFGDSSASKAGKDYFLTGDVTTNRGANTYVYKKSGADGSGSQWSTNYSTDAFQGALHTNVDPLGLPDSKNYYNKLKDSLNKDSGLTFYVAPDKPSNSKDYNNGFGCSDYKGITKKSGGKCPDVAQATFKDDKGKTQTSNKPVFATVRVEICSKESGGKTEGKVRIVKYNSALTNAVDPEVRTKYIEPLGEYKIADIPQGTIYVEGGNVEVVNVKSFASSGLSTSYVVDKNGNGINDDESDKVNHGLMGGLTIAANVNGAREEVRDSVGNDKYKGSAANPNDDDGTLYSDRARALWESTYNSNKDNIQPPYSNAQFHEIYKDLEARANEMVVKGRDSYEITVSDGNGKSHKETRYRNWAKEKRGWDHLEDKYYSGEGGQSGFTSNRKDYPSPATKGSKDIYKWIQANYSDTSLASDKGKKYWPTMTSSGVENEGNTFIGSDLTYGNDPTAALGIVTKKSILLNDRSNYKRQLSIHGLFMCIDHSLQFDWRNKSGNPLHDKLNAMDTKSNGGTPETKGRTIVLNGAIVGGFLDAEGDTFGRGYYTQSFKHDDNLLLNPPPNVPQWDITKKSLKNFAILSYEDRGAINITE